MSRKPAIFSLSANKELAKEVSCYLNLPLTKVSVKHFKDGEILVEPEETIRGLEVFIIQSTCGPVSENLMELLIAIDACKRASAKSITAVIPYYGYARQDRKARPRQPISSKLVADMIQVAGANRVVTVDLHAPQIQGFFNIPTDDLTAVNLIGKHFRDKYRNKDIVVVSPDHGGATRARKLADILHCSIAIVDKRRPVENQVEVMNLVGEVDGRLAIIVDDICDTAGSLLASVDMLLSKGATEVHAAVTHGVLSDPALDNIMNSKIKSVAITNTIPLNRECKKISQISVGPMIAATIKAIYEATPVSAVYEIFMDDQDESN